MRNILSLSAFLLLSAVVTAEDKGFVKLFNGENLDGWEQKNGTATYKVEEGVIVGTTKEGSPNSFLCTTKNYGDFILEFEVKVDDSLNSGVQIRSQSKEDYRKGRVHGYQVEIATNGHAGFIYDEARRGWLGTKKKMPNAKTDAFKKGEWNKYRVEAKGDSFKTWVNGQPVEDMTDDMDKTGFIGLQVHSYRGDKPAQVRWRNIRIKELK